MDQLFNNLFLKLHVYLRVQVVMWDISAHEARLKNHKSNGARANKTRSDIFDVEYQRSPVWYTQIFCCFLLCSQF